MHVIFDIDQTLFPLFRAMRLCPGGEGVIEEECHEWHTVEEMTGVPIPELIEMAIQPNVASQVGLYNGAKEALDSLRERGLDVAIATHREKKYHSVTEEFLVGQGLGDVELFVDEELEKNRLLYGGGVLIDDAPYNIEKAYFEGSHVATLSHPYNKNIRMQLGIPSAPDWDRLRPVVEKMLGL